MSKYLRAGGVVLFLTVVLVGRVGSDTGKSATAPRPRIAVVNLAYILKNYEKFKVYQKEMTELMKPFRDRDEDSKKMIAALAKEAKSEDTTEERRVTIKKQIETLIGEIEKNKADAQKDLSKKQEAHLKVLYGDIQAAVKRYAREKEIDLVLHYNDAITEADLNNPQNIARKMQSGAAVPLYTAPGVDISKQILAMLNEELRRKKGKDG